MGKDNPLTDFERGQIEAHLQNGTSCRKIAKLLGRSLTSVLNSVNRGTENPAGKSTGRKRKLTVRDDRHIAHEASNKATSANKIKRSLHLDVSKQTILRSIHANTSLVHEKYKERPAISLKNVQERRDFAIHHVQWSDEWKRVIFSDEKKFNLDGPDGWNYYWHDLRKDHITYAKRKYGGCSVKVWLAISCDRKSKVAFYKGALNSRKCQDILRDYLLPMETEIALLYEDDPIFQQDNDSAHVSDATLEWLEAKGITLLGWPANSPDLSPIENVFGVLSRAVYADNHQFSTVRELEEKIVACWDNLSQESIRAHIDSMNQRMIEVIEHQGKSTSF